MKRRVTHHTRAARARREFLMKLVVWIFIAFFALSAAGAVMVFAFQTNSPGR